MDTTESLQDIIRGWKKRSRHYHPVMEERLGRHLEAEVLCEFTVHPKTRNLTPRSNWFKKRAVRTIERMWKRIQRDHQRRFSSLTPHLLNTISAPPPREPRQLDRRLRIHLLLKYMIAPGVVHLNANILHQGKKGVEQAIIVSCGYWGRGNRRLSQEEIERLAKTLQIESKYIPTYLEQIKIALWADKPTLSPIRECIVETPSLYEQKLCAGCQLFTPEALLKVYSQDSLRGYELAMSRQYPALTFAVLKIVNCKDIDELADKTEEIIRVGERISCVIEKRRVVQSYRNLMDHLNHDSTYEYFYQFLATEESVAEEDLEFIAFHLEDENYRIFF